MSLVRGVAANSLLPLAGLVTAPILARALGPDGRGQLAAILQPLTVMDAIAAFGLPIALSILIAGGHNAQQLWRKAALIGGVTSTAGLLLLAAYATHLSSDYGLALTGLICIFAAVVPGTLLALRKGVALGLGSWKRLDLESSVGTAVRVGAVLLGAYVLQLNSFGYATLFVFMGLASTALIMLPPAYRIPTQGSTPSTKHLLKLATPSWLGSVAMAGTARIDQVLMPFYVSASQLGAYSVAVTVAEVPLILGVIAARELTHRVAGDSKPGPVTKYVGILTLVAAGGCAIAAVTLPWLLPAFFGADFDTSVRPAQLLLAGTALNIVNLMLAGVLNGLRRPGLASCSWAIGLAATCIVILASGAGEGLQFFSVVAVASQSAVTLGMAVGLIVVQQGRKLS